MTECKSTLLFSLEFLPACSSKVHRIIVTVLCAPITLSYLIAASDFPLKHPRQLARVIHQTNRTRKQGLCGLFVKDTTYSIQPSGDIIK
jgi:hypothetical protein